MAYRFLQKSTVAQLTKNFPDFRWIQISIPMFKTVHHLAPSLHTGINNNPPTHPSLPSAFYSTYFITTLQSLTIYPRSDLPYNFPGRNFVCGFNITHESCTCSAVYHSKNCDTVHHIIKRVHFIYRNMTEIAHTNMSTTTRDGILMSMQGSTVETRLIASC